MRPILALAILMLGLKAVAAEAVCPDSLPIAGEHLFTSSLEFNLSIGNGAMALAPPSEPADAPHDQGEEAAEPPQSPAPASTKIDEESAHSVGDLCNALRSSAEDYHLPVPFFANLIWQESRLQLNAVSRVGALGIAQFMPKVAVEVGLSDPFDPRQAIPASARFLHALRTQFGNLGYVAAAYNAGAHRVTEWLDHGRTLPRETQTYVMRVTGRSVEAWRKSPVNDSQLFFVRLLPCRELPTFTDLEQTSLKAMQVAQAQQQAELQEQKAAHAGAANGAKNAPEKVAGKVAAKGAKNVPEKALGKVAARVAKEIEKKFPAGHRLAAAERKEVRKGAHFAAADKMARNFHAGKHEPAHHQHAGHEKRRVA
jgi:hypothetical protein